MNASDAYGMTLVEAIYRGINWRLRFRGLEANKPGLLQAMQMFGSSSDPGLTLTPLLANIGTRWTKYAQSLVLTSILGAYPPTMPTSLTAVNAALAPQSGIEQLMTSKMREVPMEMVLFPYQSVAGSIPLNVSFTTT